TAGGCLGILLPPSVMLIVYGATTGVSVVQLYAGAFFPGLMLAGLYVGYVMLVAKLRPDMAPPLSKEERQLALPAGASTIAGQGYTHAMTGMLATLFKGRRNSGVSMRFLSRNMAVALVPLLIFVALTGAV